MRNFLEYSLGIVITFVLYTISGKISFSFSQLFNFFTLLVLYFAMTKGEIHGAIMGTASGLLQDSFSAGAAGINGLSKTLIGYIAGIVSHRINVVPLVRNFIFIFIMISGDIAFSTFLYYFISSEYNGINRYILFQPLSTALFGCIFFFIMRKFKKFHT